MHGHGKTYTSKANLHRPLGKGKIQVRARDQIRYECA